MKKFCIYKNEKDCEAALFTVSAADSFWERFRGLMLKKSLPEKTGLLLLHCGSIHCFFMRFTIDVVYLSDKFEVVGKETVRPWRVGSVFRGARHVLEVGAGAAEEISVGDKLILEPAKK